MEYRLVCWIMNVNVEVTVDLVGGESEGVAQCNVEIRRRLAPGAANYLLLFAADSLSSTPLVSVLAPFDTDERSFVCAEDLLDCISFRSLSMGSRYGRKALGI
jgi:hypothetical protein